MDSIFVSPSLMDQLFDTPTPTNSQREDEFEGSRKRIDVSINKHWHKLCQGTRNKKIYPSPQWRRDSTNRLQRKSIRKSLSLESAIDQIGESDSEVTDFDDSIWNSTNINDGTPRWQRVEYECSMKLRRDLMPAQNHNIFSSTMNNGYSRKAVPERNLNPAPLFDNNKENLPANNRRNQTRKLNIDNRLQRKSIRKSLSFESAINQIGESESVVTDFDDSIWNSTNINDPTPRWQRVEYECSMKLRRDLITVKNRNIFSSTMKNGYSRKAVPESNTNLSPMFDSNKENSPANNQHNRTRKFKIGNSLIDWSPFWDRNSDSRRLNRRHYVTDFFDSMEQ